MSPAPLVSVCVPTRDRAALLGEALGSALAQEGPELEVVVCDDASSDGTPELLAGLADGRVRTLRNPRALGVAGSRARCLAAARGRHVAWLDCDDTLLPGALARQVAVLEAHPEVALVHGGFAAVGPAGEPLRARAAPFGADAVEAGPQAVRELLAANEVATSTVVARRAALLRTGTGTPGESSSDWAMWLRLALRGDVAYTAAPGARYRQHAATISAATAADGRRLRCDLRVIRAFLAQEHAALTGADDLAAIARTGLAVKALQHAGELRVRGRRTAALRTLALATRLAPGALGRHAPGLARHVARGDAAAAHRATGQALAELAAGLGGTRAGARLAAEVAPAPAWERSLARAGDVVRDVVPAGACVGAVTKWDPALLARAGREGRNFPDRETLPEGYPADSAAAVAHLEAERRRGLTHLVLPSASFWWLEHYTGLAAHLEAEHRPLWRDGDCVVFELAGGVAG